MNKNEIVIANLKTGKENKLEENISSSENQLNTVKYGYIMDIIESGKMFDTYYVSNKDKIQDSDGLGRIVFNGISLHGEKQQLDEKNYVDTHFKYTLENPTGVGQLTVIDRKTNESIIIDQFDATKAQLGMVFDKTKLVEPVVQKEEEHARQKILSPYIQQDPQKKDHVQIDLSQVTPLTLAYLMHEVPSQTLEKAEVNLQVEDTIIVKGKKELLIEEGDTFNDVLEHSKLSTPVLLERNNWLLESGRVVFPENTIVTTHKDNLSIKDLMHHESNPTETLEYPTKLSEKDEKIVTISDEIEVNDKKVKEVL